MPLKIPPDEIPTIVKISDLEDRAVEELIQAISSSRAVPQAEEMAAQIAERVPSIPIDDLSAILDTVYALYFMRELSEVSPSRFLKDLIDGIRGSKNADLSHLHADLVRVRDRFQKLLGIDTLNAVSKATALQRDGERIYCEAKILSDIRPVFSSDVSKRPPAAVVTHTLKVSYHEEGEHKSFFIVLDSKDLESLRTVLDRAQSKDKTLRALLTDARISELGI